MAVEDVSVTMLTRLKNYVLMIIAAVLLVGGAFAGVVNADATNTSIDSWAALEQNITDWNSNSGGGMLTIILSPSDGFVNTSGTNYPGITIVSNVTIMPQSDKYVELNENGHGRLFNVSNGGNLTLSGNNGGAILDLTGGKMTANHAGGIYVDGGKFTLKTGAKITNSTTTGGSGGGVFIEKNGEFTMNGGSITNCSVTKSNGEGGGVGVNYGGVFTMNGGTITNCYASAYGGGVIAYYMSVFNVSGTATVNGNTNSTVADDVFINPSLSPCSLNLVGDFTGNIGISNPVGFNKQFGSISNGAIGAENFFADNDATMFGSSDGTLLRWAKVPYVEVKTWSEFVSNVTKWTDKDQMFTVVVTEHLKNETGTLGAYQGIPVAGNITITPAKDLGGDIVIDANGMGRIFSVNSNGALTLVGNGTSTLKLTGGNMSTDGGGIDLFGGNLTLETGAIITNCNAKMGGGVSVFSTSTFMMNGGNITGCTASASGGGVYIYNMGIFNMAGGSIIKCSAPDGSGVFVSGSGTFNVNGASTVTDNTNLTEANNVCLMGSANLNLVGPFTGIISINNVSGSLVPTVGTVFGVDSINDEASAKNFVSDTMGYCGHSNGGKLEWAMVNTTVTPTGNKAEFGHNNFTTLEDNNYKVSSVILETVINVNNSVPVTFNATADVNESIPITAGYSKVTDVAKFNITASVDDGTVAYITVSVTFKDGQRSSSDIVRFWHLKNGTWEACVNTPIVDTQKKVTYRVSTSSFSPFAISIESKNAESSPSSSRSSSKHSGSTQIMQAGTPVPTQTPVATPNAEPTQTLGPSTINPVVNPTTQPSETQKSPAPVIGLFAGLGAVAFVLTSNRRK